MAVMHQVKLLSVNHEMTSPCFLHGAFLKPNCFDGDIPSPSSPTCFSCSSFPFHFWKCLDVLLVSVIALLEPSHLYHSFFWLSSQKDHNSEVLHIWPPLTSMTSLKYLDHNLIMEVSLISLCKPLNLSLFRSLDHHHQNAWYHDLNLLLLQTLDACLYG